jgi:hypothetical protein
MIFDMIDMMNQSCDAAFSSSVPASRDDGQVRQYLAADEGKRTRSMSIERKWLYTMRQGVYVVGTTIVCALQLLS